MGRLNVADESNGVIEYMPTTDLTQVRMENELMMAQCQARPRSIAQMKDELSQTLEAFPALAEDAIYRKPVGKGDDGQQKFAEGLSIRSAELLAEIYGYNRVSCTVSQIDEFTVKIEATFVDFQKGRVWQDSGILSKKYKSKTGGVSVTPDDRFYGLICKAEGSRRIREVILRSVSAPLKAWFESKCRDIMDEKLDEDAIKKIIDGFSGFGVSRQMIESILPRPIDMGLTQADKRHLAQVWTAIKHGETTVKEVFSPDDGAPEPTKVQEMLASKKADEPAKKETAKKKDEPKKESEPKTSRMEECATWLKDQTDVSCYYSDAAEGVQRFTIPGGESLHLAFGKIMGLPEGQSYVCAYDDDALTQCMNIVKRANLKVARSAKNQ